MIDLTLLEIATIIGGGLNELADPSTVVTGTVQFDSRKVQPGDLFLVLPGERVDGADFAPAAVAKGAVAVLAAHPLAVPTIIAPHVEPNTTNSLAFSADHDGSGAIVLAALAKLAHYVVQTLVRENGLFVIGITGSAGKTSAKDLLAATLIPVGEVVAPPGSFNNELGHPWTALQARRSTQFLVMEMSARGVGHIAHLARITPPRIGVVLNVGHAHLGEFGSVDAIASTKGELVEALPSAHNGGVAVLNIDDPRVWDMRDRTSARIVSFGFSEGADFQATDISLDAHGCPSFTLIVSGHKHQVTLSVSGRHQILNALVAIAVATECGGTLDSALAAVSQATIISGRRMEVSIRDDGVTIINDSYNANPDSMRAALLALKEMAQQSANEERPRTWAVLGEMAELGDASCEEHKSLGQFVRDRHISGVILVGQGLPVDSMYVGVSTTHLEPEPVTMTVQVEKVKGINDALVLLSEKLHSGDFVLVKASHSTGLWKLADQLTSSTMNSAVAEVEDIH